MRCDEIPVENLAPGRGGRLAGVGAGSRERSGLSDVSRQGGAVLLLHGGTFSRDFLSLPRPFQEACGGGSGKPLRPPEDPSDRHPSFRDG